MIELRHDRGVRQFDYPDYGASSLGEKGNYLMSWFSGFLSPVVWWLGTNVSKDHAASVFGVGVHLNPENLKSRKGTVNGQEDITAMQ